MLGTNIVWTCLRQGILGLLLFGLLPTAQAVSLPAATTSQQAQKPADETAAQEPSIEDKKAARLALATILENSESRQTLIKELRDAADNPSATDEPMRMPPKAVVKKDDRTVLESVTRITREYGGYFTASVMRLYNIIVSMPQTAFDKAAFFNALNHFMMLAVAMFTFYWAIRRIMAPFYRRMGRWARAKSSQPGCWLYLPLTIFMAFVIELLLLALALSVGQISSNNMNAGNSIIARQQGLFLNAFALVEFFKSVLRLIFSPNFPELRPVVVNDERAHYWHTRLSWLGGVIGYGLIVVVPIVSKRVNEQTGALVNVIIMALMTGWALVLIFRNRRIVQHKLNEQAERSLAFFALFIRAFAFIWQWVASAYFIVLFFLSIFNPGGSLQFMVSATINSVIIISIGAVISGILTHWIDKTITLSPEMRRNYPELQKRVNSWVSVMLKAARILTVLSVLLLLLNAWSLFDLRAWLTAGAGERLVDVLIRVFMILFFSVVGWTLLASLIESRLSSDIDGRPMPSARTRTLLTLFRNALAVVISTITIMILLSEIGVNIAPLLAGAGALGLAVSFGSQTLVKDIITGVFIQFENGMNTGDLVTIGPLTGTVERMSIRSVGVRQDTGAYHIIPWSSITTFANFVRGIGSFVANYEVDRNENSDNANAALRAAVHELLARENMREFIIGEPNFAGLVGLTERAFTIRVSITTQPLKQWAVRFALDELVKKHFDAAGIRAPRQTVQVVSPKDEIKEAAVLRLPPPDQRP